MRSFAFLLLLCATRVFAADGPCPATWGYESTNGPNRWGQMDERWAACDNGHIQSPIDLGVATYVGYLPELTINYEDAPLVVQNTGHEIKVPLGAGTIMFGNTGATLVQFHFHVKSEHAINGKHARAELHLVHETKDKKIIVIAVMIDSGDENEALKTILKLRPDSKCASKKSTEKNFKPTGLLPAKLTEYYNYTGSLTTPACNEGVTFIVLRQHITASSAQLDALKVDHENARPIQPLGNRTVSRNF